MDIFQVLKKDHDAIRHLFTALTELDENDLAKRENLFEGLKSNLASHTEAEEQIVYPILLSKRSLEEHVREGIEEHRMTRLLLGELDDLEPSDAQFMAKVKALKDLTFHHLEEEEEDLFKDARDMLSDDELETMRTGFVARKREVAFDPEAVNTSIHQRPLEVTGSLSESL